MDMEPFTTKTDVFIWGNGSKIGCMGRENCSTMRTSLSMKGSGTWIASKGKENFTIIKKISRSNL